MTGYANSNQSIGQPPETIRTTGEQSIAVHTSRYSVTRTNALARRGRADAKPARANLKAIDLFADMASILISIVSKTLWDAQGAN